MPAYTYFFTILTYYENTVNLFSRHLPNLSIYILKSEKHAFLPLKYSLKQYALTVLSENKFTHNFHIS